MSAIHDLVVYASEVVKRLHQSLSDPKQFLEVGFQPTEEQILEGVEFHIALLMASGLVYTAFAAARKDKAADNREACVNATLGFLSTSIIALAWHVAFWLFGGSASFAGTYLTYVYASGPYVLFSVVGSLFVVAGLPTTLQPLALNPATASVAINKAKEDPDTSWLMVGLGSLASWGALAVGIVVFLKCLSYTHDLSGWGLVGAVVVSLLLAPVVSQIFNRLAAVIRGNDSPSVVPEKSDAAPDPKAANIPLPALDALGRDVARQNPAKVEAPHEIPAPRTLAIPYQPAKQPVAPMGPSYTTPALGKNTARPTGRWITSVLLVILLATGLGLLVNLLRPLASFSEAAMQPRMEARQALRV